MAAPLPMSSAASDPAAWHELEDSFARLGELARTAVAPDVFYRQLLEECVRALAGSGGVVWLRAASGAMQPAVMLHWSMTNIARDDEVRRDHESLLARTAANGKVITTGTTSESALLLAPVAHGSPARQTSAIIEIRLRSDLSPATHRAYEQFMGAVCEIASDFQAHDELRRLRHDQGYYGQLLQFGRATHRSLNLTDTAFAIANEGRRVIDCDRLSVLAAAGRRCRLLATSGVSRFDRRSTAARELERLAELVRLTDEPASYANGQTDALPAVADVLEKHAEQSHARQIAAIPLRRPIVATADGSQHSTTNTHVKRHDSPRFVLVAEQFDACHGELALDRFVEIGDVCATALYNALEVDQLAFGWLLRPLTKLKRLATEHVARSVAIMLLTTAAIAALLFVPADFSVEAPGRLEPVARRDVFAPRSGLVDTVLVAPGDEVKTGQALLRLRDPQLELELNRVHGELETAQRQLDAVRATRTNREVRDAGAVESYRLSAEQRELDQQLANLRAERELLERERDALVVTSPIAGKILTWDLANRLVARPVERGEVLVTVADPSADWQLELDVPDDQIGHVLGARTAIQPDLPVEFRLSSDDRELHVGQIREVCLTADVVAEPNSKPSPTVLVKVALPDEQVEEMRRGELRPGVSARARIACGERSLGYVWLHDIWDAAIAWLRF